MENKSGETVLPGVVENKISLPESGEKTPDSGRSEVEQTRSCICCFVITRRFERLERYKNTWICKACLTNLKTQLLLGDQDVTPPEAKRLRTAFLRNEISRLADLLQSGDPKVGIVPNLREKFKKELSSGNTSFPRMKVLVGIGRRLERLVPFLIKLHTFPEVDYDCYLVISQFREIVGAEDVLDPDVMSGIKSSSTILRNALELDPTCERPPLSQKVRLARFETAVSSTNALKSRSVVINHTVNPNDKRTRCRLGCLAARSS